MNILPRIPSAQPKFGMQSSKRKASQELPLGEPRPSRQNTDTLRLTKNTPLSKKLEQSRRAFKFMLPLLYLLTQKRNQVLGLLASYRKSQARLANWDDPEYRDKQKDARSDPSYKQKQSKAAMANWDNPEYRDKQKDARSDPDYKQKRSKAAMANWDNPEYRDKLTEARSDPDYKQKQAEKHPQAYMKYLIEEMEDRDPDSICEKLIEKFPDKVRTRKGKTFPPIAKSQVQKMLQTYLDPLQVETQKQLFAEAKEKTSADK